VCLTVSPSLARSPTVSPTVFLTALLSVVVGARADEGCARQYKPIAELGPLHLKETRIEF
jgi:hypothetical protein